MHGSMGGYYEIRVSGPGKVQYRLFCILDNAKNRDELEERGFLEPQIAVINGMSNPSGEVFMDGDYKAHVRDLGDDCPSTFPRRIAE
jgi:hypothetical protein